MYSILYKISSEMKEWQPFNCSLIYGSSMLYCAKTCICWRYIIIFFHTFAIFELGTITTVFKHSFIQSFDANFQFVWLKVITTLSFATRTNQFCARISSLKSTASRLSCFLCLAQQVRGRKFVLELDENSSFESPHRKMFPLFFHCCSDTITQVVIT